MRPSSPPTIADLYLAYRQAKTALYFEKRGVGLLNLAAYEQELPKNLNALRGKLAEGNWFDDIELGETWIVPKRLRATTEGDDGLVRIGAPQKQAGRAVDVQVRLSPHPDFAVAEVLYLWRFGGLLETLLSKKTVLGYRLDLREQQVLPHRRWLFEYWPSRYRQFRTEPLTAAKSALTRGEQTLIVSGDLASFYDTVAPSFMMGDQLMADLHGQGAARDVLAEYRDATASLLRGYERFRREAARRAAIAIDVGVPIGALTSRVVANLSLAPLDAHVASRPGVLCYRRYVDDLVIVAKADVETGIVDTMRRFLPLRVGDDNILRLDVDALDRAGSEFQLQKAKVRVHHLAGAPGTDFVEAVASDFAQAVSERRAFVDSATLAGDGITHLVRAGAAGGSPLRVLRDADRARLERFALSTCLHSLERVSSLIDHDQAREIVRRSLERVGRVLDAEDNWVDDLDVSLRLLKLAISTGDWTSATELRERMDREWGTVDALRSSATTLQYRGREIDSRRTSAWTWLRNYLHERRLEAVCSALPIGMREEQLESRFPGGLMVRTKPVGATALRHRAERLASADLRSRDREDDGFPSTGIIDTEWLRADVKDDQDLSKRLATIDAFVQRCKELDVRAWLMPAARLFLCTRPPSYFDIARRWLYRVEQDGFVDDVFERLLAIVNAVRGTEYRDPVGQVHNSSTVSIESFWSGGPPDGPASPFDPRIILGNLVVTDDAWQAAAKRTPQAPFNAPKLTLNRFKGVAVVVEKATHVSRGRISSVLVLPELSLPRRWFRTVANHVVQLGRFGLVTGLEYVHDPMLQQVSNQVFAVFPGPFSSAATWPWTKRLPAREEGILLGKLKPPVSFPPAPSMPMHVPRTVVRSPWGALSVLICSELIEAGRVADLLGRVDVVLCPAWNPDTASYDHLIQSVGLQLHSIIAIANNGHYSDCRTWAPRAERWERELCRLIERDVDDIVYVDIPLASLVAFHAGNKQAKDLYARLRDALTRADLGAARKELKKLTEKLPGTWRPLPPDWPRRHPFLHVSPRRDATESKLPSKTPGATPPRRPRGSS